VQGAVLGRLVCGDEDMVIRDGRLLNDDDDDQSPSSDDDSATVLLDHDDDQRTDFLDQFDDRRADFIHLDNDSSSVQMRLPQLLRNNGWRMLHHVLQSAQTNGTILRTEYHDAQL
jgi:hypothetical protein